MPGFYLFNRIFGGEIATEIKNRKNTDSSFWDHLVRPRPLILTILILFAVILQLNIHYNPNISAAYTQFFYLIIVLAGLWYQRKAIWIALIFSSLYLFIEYLPPFSLSLDSIFRVVMLCLVAIIIGSISERMMILQNGLRMQNSQLQESQRALEIGNNKLNMLSSITRHDILNQLTILRNYLDFSMEIETNPKILDYMENEDKAAETIEKQISFTKYYQDIGIEAPAWQNVDEYIRSAVVELRIVNIPVIVSFSCLEVFADHLVQKVFYNLMENSLRHGGQITQMSFSFQETVSEGIIIYEDDGDGISFEDKKNLFKRGFGKNTGLGLFLSREILSITGISIQETGEPGKGVRFEILISSDKYRMRGE